MLSSDPSPEVGSTLLGLEESFNLAVSHISRWGDTDVFPFAPENIIFHDRKDETVALLKKIDGDLTSALDSHPPYIEGALSLITYEGFRYVSQIDPIWNAYMLGLALRISPEIEAARIPASQQAVFSYRLNINRETSSIFEIGSWNSFSEASQSIAQNYNYIAICDIADFYGRIYHHRLQNSLNLLGEVGDVPSKVIKLLTGFSGGVSYGLPVGGQAARIFSELLLNRVDRLLVSRGIKFCRYADDYRLFADTREDAFRALVFLTEALQRNEGLTLQRHKTRVLSTKDFVRSPLLLPEDSDELSPQERDERRLLKLSLRFDPYSDTRDEDYERLRHDVEQFDVIGMLTAEVAKSRVNSPVVKKLARIIKLFDVEVRDAAAEMLVANLDVLAPALPVVLRVLEEVLPNVSPALAKKLPAEIRRRIQAEEYWVMVPVNLAYALRILKHDHSEENVPLAARIFESAPPFIQRDIVYLMHGWKADYWLSDKRKQWRNLHPWVQRAILLASFSLGDEGRHWRQSISRGISGFDDIAKKWMEERVKANRKDLPF
ncbi:RNA-directed DNA polymerase [Micromonospora sp. NPDC005305]|uniref:RNA-directed DNA polymerase n=1 Tax=Micromonospora sp. NPDC005305 TaxID=3156875 RepID=UPI00339E7FA4